MARPRSMLAHTLNPVKGWGANPHAVDFSAKVSPAVTFDIYAGRAMHLHTDGTYRPGAHNTAMTLFAFPNSYDFDVSENGGDPASPGNDEVWIASSPTGKMLALPAKGAYELESTEYDTSVADSLYTPDKTLTSAASNTDIAVGGLLKPGTPYLVPLCGVVSRGIVASGHGGSRKAVAFWPIYSPKLLKATITAINAE